MKLCSCKGIRTCATCNPDKLKSENGNCIICYFCPKISKAVKEKCNPSIECVEFHNITFEFNGIVLIENFLTSNERIDLLNGINSNSWVDSQSGRRKQDFGPKVNFKKRKVNLTKFQGLPKYIEKFVEKFEKIPELTGFHPVELCNLEYDPAKGASIDPHFDDFWLWGERLVTINVQSSTYLTFTPGNPEIITSNEESQAFFSSFSCPNQHQNIRNCKICLKVPLRENSLIVVSGDARHAWMHAIDTIDIESTRIATTLRELSRDFFENDKEFSRKLIDLAVSYDGVLPVAFN